MAGIPMVTREGQRTYVPASGEVITGGQLVEARAGGRIGVAAAGSTTVLGVALTDAVSPESFSGDPVLTGGQYVLNAAPRPQNVAVASNGKEVPVVFSAACAFGQLVVATANGQVGPAGAAPDARTIVGRCVAPAGVTTPGTVGLVRLGN